jgi:hypothetical protein
MGAICTVETVHMLTWLALHSTMEMQPNTNLRACGAHMYSMQFLLLTL